MYGVLTYLRLMTVNFLQIVIVYEFIPTKLCCYYQQ